MKVLLAVDGSPGSQSAERVLSQFPFETPPIVRIVHVVPVPELDMLTGGVSEAVAALIDQSRADGEIVLNEAADRCRAWAERVETALLDGHVAREILLDSETWKPDVIAVGARGLGMFPRVLLGSVSDRLVNHAHCSVLTVHEAGEDYRLHRILIADDNSPAAQNAVQRFASLPLGAVRSVKLLRALPGCNFEPESGVLDQAKESARSQLAQTARKFENVTPQVSTVVKESVDYATTILETARADQTQLIVMGSQGHGAWERFTIGSVSLHVVRHAPCPVWLERKPR
jgi:nucleotide-binding universal stress UspA family protein